MKRCRLMLSALMLATVPAGAIAQTATDSLPTRFSSLQPGQGMPATWSVLPLPDKPATRFTLVADNGTTVVKAESDSAAATLVSRFRTPAAGLLSWRWKVDRVVASADLTQKTGDDFAARVYVFFDTPPSAMPLATRMKYGAVKLFYKVDLPTAALCYVWDNKHPVGHSAWSAYTDRVRVIVLRSGEPGSWREEKRDLAADFKAAFGTDAPAITGIALGSDTDQTGERVVAHFGDFVLTPAP